MWIYILHDLEQFRERRKETQAFSLALFQACFEGPVIRSVIPDKIEKWMRGIQAGNVLRCAHMMREFMDEGDSTGMDVDIKRLG